MKRRRFTATLAIKTRERQRMRLASALLLGSLNHVGGKQLEIITKNVFSQRSNGPFSIITSGTAFPTIELECRSLDGSFTTPANATMKGPVQRETAIELDVTQSIEFGVCSADGQWKTVPTCWQVDETSFCGNSKGLFCGSIESFESLGVRRVTVPFGDSVTITLKGTAMIQFDYDGYCNSATGDGVSVTASNAEVDVVYPKYTAPVWSITFRDEGMMDLPGCDTCSDCDLGGSNFDPCSDADVVVSPTNPNADNPNEDNPNEDNPTIQGKESQQTGPSASWRLTTIWSLVVTLFHYSNRRH